MITYTTLDYLSAYMPTVTEKAAARTLSFVPSSSAFLSLGYENEAITYESGNYASLRDLFKINFIEGASYMLYSSSYFDPYLLSLHDSDGRFVAVDSGTAYGNDTLTYRAPYTGTYYINASWAQGSASSNKFVYLSVLEDIDTVKVPTPTNSSITGTMGNDNFNSLTSSDAINGLAGIDTVIYAAARHNYTVTKTTNGYTVSAKTGTEGTDTLTNVERLKFSDLSIALDISGNAGTTVKILGAVYGKAAVTNKEYAGIGLQLLDGGMSYLDLMLMALNDKLGSDSDNATVVNLLYTNVVGTLPSVDDLAYFKGQLDSGSLTRASLGVLAADTAINTVNVNLVGLATSGLEYISQS